MATRVSTDPSRGTPDSVYIQRVRRHRPSELVPAIARLAAGLTEPNLWRTNPASIFSPWTLADIVRVSLARGNEHRAPSAVTDQDMLQCAEHYFGFVGSELAEATPGAGRNAILRMTAEQLPFQHLDLHHMGRVSALLLQTQALKPLRVIQPGWDSKILGCSLTEYVGIGQLLVAAAIHNEGTLDLEWFNQPQMDEISERIDRNVIRQTIIEQYVISVDDFRSVNPKFEQSGDLRRYSYNPLVSKPVIEGLTESLVIPVPQAVMIKFGMLGIYHVGVAAHGDDFAVDLGHLFEQYVGRQLELIPGAQVIPEIEYGPKKQRRFSIDWFVILPSVVLLVEVKSVRPTDPVRLASENADDELVRLLRKPLEQIQTTEDRISDRTAEFTHIPTDRPHIGLAVTLEPFHMANSLWLRDIYRPSMSIPAVVVSVDELEHMVTLSDVDVGAFLQEHIGNPATEHNYVGSSLVGKQTNRNTVIDAGFLAYPWRVNTESDPQA